MPKPDKRSATPLRNPLGKFWLHAFQFGDREHAALVFGTPHELREPPLVRIQSACLTGVAFHSVLCDCRQQLEEAVARIVDEGAGVVLYLDQEGRGHGLVEKVAQLALIAEGADTVEAAALRGVEGDVRSFEDARAILRELVDDAPVRLLTNNPEKMRRVTNVGIEVVERVPIETEPTDGNRAYLLVKKLHMGHLLTGV
ncbi:MAG: 3,4-dihydroxy 2-butanone 4-phosphate synthase / cyclohydrolase [Thermoleophilaceae bacterium]|jgi:GTP cyclohydrolase II|nr:3,4-dihydroxy 2-butanone 4-phosphate synthase / cyclohydrolase [Thermoleophilaceae bacterium]